MFTSYYDLGLQPVDAQRAAAKAFQVQQKGRLAVLPSMDLSGAIKQNMENRRAAETLAIEQRKVDLVAKKQDFDQSQLPWTVAGGALGAAARLYGGYQAWQDSDALKKLYAENQEMREQGLADATIHSYRVRGLTDEQTGVLGQLTAKRPPVPASFDFTYPTPKYP